MKADRAIVIEIQAIGVAGVATMRPETGSEMQEVPNPITPSPSRSAVTSMSWGATEMKTFMPVSTLSVSNCPECEVGRDDVEA